MSTLNFQALNFAAEFGILNWGTLKIFKLNFLTFYLILNILTLKNKAENDLLKNVRVKFRGKKSKYIISMHKYSVLRFQWLFIFKI